MSFRKPCHMPFLVLPSPLLIRPKRAFLRVRWWGLPYCIFAKELTHDFGSKLKSLFLIVFFFLNGKKKRLKMVKTANKAKKSDFKSLIVGVAILNFCFVFEP